MPVSNLPPMKAMMKLVGLDCGPLRLPMANPGDEKLEALREAMQAKGFFDWINL
jgi:N-acetylneuraminate lyase